MSFFISIKGADAHCQALAQSAGNQHDIRAGTAPISPWNAAHPSTGCNNEKLASTGSAGLLYCFAID